MQAWRGDNHEPAHCHRIQLPLSRNGITLINGKGAQLLEDLAGFADSDPDREKYPAKFDIDELRCIYSVLWMRTRPR